jgi:hypothetical protein
MPPRHATSETRGLKVAGGAVRNCSHACLSAGHERVDFHARPLLRAGVCPLGCHFGCQRSRRCVPSQGTCQVRRLATQRNLRGSRTWNRQARPTAGVEPVASPPVTVRRDNVPLKDVQVHVARPLSERADSRVILARRPRVRLNARVKARASDEPVTMHADAGESRPQSPPTPRAGAALRHGRSQHDCYLTLTPSTCSKRFRSARSGLIGTECCGHVVLTRPTSGVEKVTVDRVSRS